MSTAALSRDELQQRLEQIDRVNGKESLFYFAKYVLGYTKMQRRPHMDVCQFIESIVRGARFGLDLEPRGSFKTTQFSQALPIWMILQNPNIRILLDSAVLQNSIDNLGVIKRHLEGNDKLRYLFGNYVGEHWTTEAITVSKRTDRGLKEPTVRCASVERVQVGPHYDAIIADDLVSKDNCTTPEARTAIKEHFRLLFSLLEPDGILIVVGTRWNYDDLYGMIADEFPEFGKRIMCAGGSCCSHGKAPYFPEILTDEFLVQQKRRQTSDIYNCQYENDPTPEDADAAFQKAWFLGYDTLPKLDDVFSFIAIDPGGREKGSDEWAIMSEHVDADNFKYFDRLFKGNYRTEQAWDILFDLAAGMPKIMAVGLETTGGQKYLLEGLQAEMRRRNKFLNVIPLAHAKESKVHRIKSFLQPQYRAGAIKHSAMMKPLEDQLLRFPKGKDDVADVAAMAIEIAQAPVRRKPKEQPPKTFDELIWRQVTGRGTKGRFVHSVLGSEG